MPFQPIIYLPTDTEVSKWRVVSNKHDVELFAIGFNKDGGRVALKAIHLSVQRMWTDLDVSKYENVYKCRKLSYQPPIDRRAEFICAVFLNLQNSEDRATRCYWENRKPFKYANFDKDRFQ